MKRLKSISLALALILIGANTAWAETGCTLAAIPCEAFSDQERARLSESARVALNAAWAKYPSRSSPYVVLFDTRLNSSSKRFFVINRKTKKITAYLAAHGKGSDPDHDGWLDSFSDLPGSKATPKGAFRTAETYSGKHGYSLKLDGLEETNKSARDRAIVIHGADYVSEGRNPIGRSWGCPALETRYAKEVIDKIKGGALLVITG